LFPLRVRGARGGIGGGLALLTGGRSSFDPQRELSKANVSLEIVG